MGVNSERRTGVSIREDGTWIQSHQVQAWARHITFPGFSFSMCKMWISSSFRNSAFAMPGLPQVQPKHQQSMVFGQKQDARRGKQQNKTLLRLIHGIPIY